MKVSELEGALLDYWVARAEGNLTLQSTGPDDAIVEQYGVGGEIEGRSPLASWAPSENWDTGGPIIARERIALWACDSGYKAAHPAVADHGYYDVELGVVDVGGLDGMEGSTPLVAAMRAFVASKFGDEVSEKPSL
ncbi:phage protein NinX family protein [Cupriavidus sp. IDO]|uniref:phage protein NinX family protein n=1 Tax=Cupriavidus sp. IDO TaxID=1539142 RepID=UPI000578FC84|nr:phage protein NinX family protein [Cupriavidus sp. IDO]KWR88783.1 hypothetical protein RM96_17875 [Cupriavidus sp. IDO]